MPNLTEVSNFDTNIYEIQTTDPVLGGEGGILNKAAQNLANRTKWLKDKSGIYTKVTGSNDISTASLIDASMVGNIIRLRAVADNLTVTIDAAANFSIGNILRFKTICAPGKSITIQFSNGEQVTLDNNLKSKLFLHDGEFLRLIVWDGGFEVEDCSQDMFDVGLPIMSMTQAVKNTIVRNGSLINRSNYPRITEWALNTLSSAYGGEVVDDATWNSYQFINGVYIYPYKSKFSLGDGITTIRIPDDRGLFERNADLGAGVDISRMGPGIGSFENMSIQTHDHPNGVTDDRPNNVFPYNSTTAGLPGKAISNIRDDGIATPVYQGLTGAYGEIETKPKNVNKIPLIKI